ncbi:hypothetical protein J416_15577 [Gracilibacillus halophilus YIM-C55.5]|uniref:DUF2197 domain-containing protein n=1 Tax=Gracilibacillus halophilus YIM-C55.5 TaxID=1308866 RepID=N4W5R7_9BACI|nr:YlaI family protein [Gracilibacillus halophilus]ENH95538.1 hypothetical protein J416_15577 [Gracilibacillus halophilus YIM-C55.5]
MRVKCALCEKIEKIDNDSPEAKKLRNRRIHTYMCPECNERITTKTNERHATGNFQLFRQKKTKDLYI